MGSSPLDRRIKGTLLADYCHVTGFYPHDPALLSLYSTSSSSLLSSSTTNAPTNNSTTSTSLNTSTGQPVNPFSLLSLSKDMGQQEKWRKDPSIENIDIAAITGVSLFCYILTFFFFDMNSIINFFIHRILAGCYYVCVKTNFKERSHLFFDWFIQQ